MIFYYNPTEKKKEDEEKEEEEESQVQNVVSNVLNISHMINELIEGRDSKSGQIFQIS